MKSRRLYCTGARARGRDLCTQQEAPSSLWTRGVYYEGLTALWEIDQQQRYIDYIDRWANAHQWTPRNGVKTTDADDQCCEQTYLWRYRQTKDEKMLKPTVENLNLQMPTDKRNYWWWIDAIQMAMPVYAQLAQITGDRKYMDYAMQQYRYSRNEEGGGLLLEPWQRMGVCRTGALHDGAASQRPLLQGTEEGLPAYV